MMSKLTPSLKGRIFSCLIFLFSCNQRSLDPRQWNNAYPPQKTDRSFQLTGHRQFPLDSITSLSYGLMQYAEKFNRVVGFNPYDNSFIFFDYNSSRCIQKVRLSKDPSKGVGSFANVFSYNFYFINYDSILLLNKHEGKLFLVDSAAHIKRSYSLKEGHQLSRPEGAFGEQIVCSEGKVYITAAPGRDPYDTDTPFQDNLVAVVDLANGTVAYRLHYPEMYRDAFWGRQLHNFYSAFNPDRHLFVYSFPIDHYLYVDEVTADSSHRKYAGSKYIPHVNPISFGGGKFNPNAAKDAANFTTQRTYSRILYDKYRHVYYRFVTGKVGEDKRHTDFSIIILNNDLEKTGEQDFDGRLYQSASSFITKDGLFLARKGGNEDVLSYDLFTITNIS